MITSDVQEAAPLIRAEVDRAQNILLHLHPGPDEDSVGSVLAMYHWLTAPALNKAVTVIKGDSGFIPAYAALPGYDRIENKNYFEINPAAYDLFLILDAGSPGQISKRDKIVFPENLHTIVIDHHLTNSGFGNINLIEPAYPATSQILYDLFKLWRAEISPEMAVCLLVGINGDTGGFIYPNTGKATLLAAAELIDKAPNFSRVISEIRNNHDPKEIAFEMLALNSMETLFNGKVKMAAVAFGQLSTTGIEDKHIDAGLVAHRLRSIAGCEIGVSLIESQPAFCRVSLRSRDGKKFDVSLVAARLAGGGHQAAAGGSIGKPLAEAKEILMKTIVEIYPEIK